MNDSLGHAAGDQVLVTVAQRIRRALRPADLPARLGGDEFAVLLEDASEEALERVADRLLAEVTEPVLVDGRPVRVGASIGTALQTPAIATVDGLLAAADAAMYAAKRSGKNRAAAFVPGMYERAKRPLGLAADLAS